MSRIEERWEVGRGVEWANACRPGPGRQAASKHYLALFGTATHSGVHWL